LSGIKIKIKTATDSKDQRFEPHPTPKNSRAKPETTKSPEPDICIWEERRVFKFGPMVRGLS
jgi:hypothetical protein